MSRKRIVQLAKNDHHVNFGGIETITKSIEKHLKTRTFFCPDSSLLSLKNFLRLFSYIIKEKNVVVIIHSPSIWLPAALLFLLVSKVEIFVLRHCVLSGMKSFFTFAETLFVKSSKRIKLITTSPCQNNEESEHISLFSNLPEVPIFNASLDNRNHFIFIGRDSHYKNIHFLLSVYKKYIENGGKLKLIFCTPNAKQIKKFAQKIGILDLIIWRESLSGEEINKELLKSRALLLPSELSEEGFGIVQLDALNCGTPVVANNIPNSGVGWLHKSSNGVIGILNDIEKKKMSQKWIECLVYLENIDDKTFEEMSRSSTKHVKNFTEQNFIDRLEEILEV